ncbi:helix-turn-helix transcriptional regulator [Vibrio salinus]|uniref:helix-turn-helix transcriptional regulator n=1 Tax=Vibrio salinus TaxID=2899784 RepID=UPI001E550A24|nr:YafY family protein [Vibrio salinus]MCE0494167.1 YafY family transcriptional regulator [Vibrio salinus]
MTTRTQRLLDIVQILRTHKYPVTASYLAEKLEISIRTVYRDIATLQQQGVDIQGSAGVGLILKSDHHLPPLMFSRNELDALILGLNWVKSHTDPALRESASQSLAKLHSVVPEPMKHHIEFQSLLTGPVDPDTDPTFLPEIRSALHHRKKIKITYRDKNDDLSTRILWPVAIGFISSARLLVGWCELRKNFRHFRADRIQTMTVLEETCPKSHAVLLKAWRDSQGIASPERY